jgi:dihydroneopterin triphosphate diphosphatase
MTAHKIPISVLVVIHTRDLDVLLLERADRPGFWQSVTGSQDEEGESLRDTAIRELMEETALNANEHVLTDWGKQNEYEIYTHWRHRYAPGVTRNTEHVFGLTLLEKKPITIAPREHLQYEWLPWQEAAEKVFSWSNREAILLLPQYVAGK